jgi:GT2 family glycosyltransferase
VTTKPRCAVVIPTFNGSHLLSTCLEALLSYPPERCEMNVIVVDDASSDGTVERFGARDEDVTMVARERNGGFAHACNDGAGAAGDAEYLIFLNNDTIPIPGWLDALVDEAREHDATAVGSKLLYPNGTVQHAGITIGQDRWPHNLYVGMPGEHDAVNRAKSMPAVTAACLLIRRDAFEQAGGFDTAFLNGYEDVDLCLRLGEEGHEVRYCPKSVLYHLESVTRWADYSVRHTSDNDRLYAERWLDRVKPDDIEHYLADGLISVGYGPSYPVRMAISPLLATVDRETEPEDRLEQLLSIRTDELMDMRAQQIRGTLERSRREPALPLIGPMRARSGGTAEVVQRGEFHGLGSSGASRHRVSVLMPVMDAGAALRRTLPILLEQEVDAELEIVAVDSASTDDTVEVLEEFGATVLTIDPTEFDHGLTRNLLAAHARGDYLVLLNGLSRPCDENWLAPLVSVLAGNPTVAGVASRVLPYPEADLLTRRDVELDPSGSEVRSIKRIADRAEYEAMPIEQRRLLLNFHTVSAAIRADVLRRIPFRSVRAIGEDLLWSREVLEAGLALVHEPDSRVYHSHDYSLREWFMRNVDDGIANRDINERSLSEEETDALVRGMIESDWAYLRDELGLEGDELRRWQIQASLRRTAQAAGQWLGVNYASMPPQAVAAFSRVAGMRRNA